MALLSDTQLIQRVNQTNNPLNNSAMFDLVDSILSTRHRLNRTLVDLTATGQTTLYTVPTGYKAVVVGVNLVGETAQAGAGRAAVLKVGTAAGSYAEILDRGYIFQVNNGITLIPVNQHRLLAYDARVPRLISRTLVLLTAAAQTSLYTVPTGAALRVDKVVLEGGATISGGTSSKLLIGTTAGSYVELLNGSTGVTFTSGTATSLLAAGARIDVTTSIALPATMSLANTPDFAAGAEIKADVSGTVVTAGSVYVELWGNLSTDGPKEFAAGTTLKADVSALGALSLPTSGKVYAELVGYLIATNQG